MTGLVRTRTVALDTAQLADWARDRASARAERRRRAELFETVLAEQGALVMLSWHHVEELLGTETLSAAAEAIDLLAALPAVAWIEPADGEGGLPTVVDLLAAELAEALDQPKASVHLVRDAVLLKKLRTGSGATAVGKYLQIWRDLQPYLWKSARQSREIFAITASTLFDHNKMKVSDILRAGARQGEALERQFAHLQLALQRDISLHGDQRLDNHAGLSGAFLDMVRGAGARPASGAELLHWVLEQQGVDLSELDDDATFGDISALGHFRKQMTNAAEVGQLDPAKVREVDMKRIPSWLMETALRRHRQVHLERRGSELNDAHLAGLAAYADVTFVDKRTREALRQAIHAKSLPMALLNTYAKNGPYFDAFSRL
jgi:hypothetical protein